MKTTPVRTRAREKAWALLVVMALAAAGLLLVASVIAWANENATVTARNSEFFTTTYAAEAATEKALGAIVQDDQNYGEGLVLTRSAAGYYSTLIPTPHDSSYWTNYQFSGGTTNNTVIVECINKTTTNVLGPPYSGLQSVGATYEIVASAKNNNSMYGITATVGQQVVLGQIPIFQFAIFYNDTLEIDPGANMNINGMVHGNTNLYIDPNSGVVLTFSNDVSATGTLNLSANPLDPSSRPTVGSANFNGNHLADVNPLNLPVGTNVSGNTTNVGDNVSAILQVPPAGESSSSATGTNRLYNQVDLIITVSNGNVITVTSGMAVNNAATVISNAPFVNTNGAFYNMRDGAEVAPVNIDVGQLRQWSATNTVLAPLLTTIRGASQSAVQSIFVVDQRYLSNAVIITNYSYTTNTTTTTTTSYPGAGTFFPPITTNTIIGTSSSLPPANTYVPPMLSTNLTSTTTSSHPGSGTYVGAITTNTTLTVSSTHPASGTYTGSITTNTVGGVKIYTYNALSYTYNVVSGYIFNEITGYTYALITGTTTNLSYTTNLVQYAEPGVVLTNGATLPANGLSVVTPDPLYIVGNWNVTNNSGQGMVQTYNVSDTLPSAVFADAVTILSPAWNPSYSSSNISSRVAAPDTVNAAILTGNVPSNNTYYSGGVENFPRFQENWSGVNFYYNGSMVEMFQSRIANFPWPGTGTVYNPPVRDWAFDTNFNNPNQLPPLTPKVIYLNRARWSSLAPGSTWF
jgi:hypothetical protein